MKTQTRRTRIYQSFSGERVQHIAFAKMKMKEPRESFVITLCLHTEDSQREDSTSLNCNCPLIHFFPLSLSQLDSYKK